LEDLYTNTPIFDEVAMFGGKSQREESHWNKIGKYLLSNQPGQKEKFMKYI